MTDSNSPAAQLPYATPTSRPDESAALNRYDFAILAVRLMGFYLLIEILPTAVTFLSSFTGNWAGARFYGYQTVLLVTYSAAAVILIVLGPRIGPKLVPAVPHHQPIPSGSASAVQLHGVAIATCGIILLTFRGVPGLILYLWAYYNRPGSRAPDLLAQNVIETLLGIFLFFGAGAIARYWERSRDQAKLPDGVPTANRAE